MPNLANLLHDTALTHPHRVAVVDEDHRFTYRELEEQASRTANLLARRGIGPGARVMLLCPNSAAFSASYYGILKTGAAVVPINTQLKAREIAYHLRDSDSAMVLAHVGSPQTPTAAHAAAALETVGSDATLLLITDGGPSPGGQDASDVPANLARYEPLAHACANEDSHFSPAAVSPDDTAVILYTSGTTGEAKGAELRHRNMTSNALVGRQVFGTSVERPDTFLCALPLFHSFGQTVLMNQAFATGGRVVMMRRFLPHDALRLMRSERVTFFSGVPTMFLGLLQAAAESDDAHGLSGLLRIANSGGAALPSRVHRDFAERFGVTIAEGYGLSETSPVVSFSPLGAVPRVGSIGKPIPGVEMKLVDDDWHDIEGVNQVGEIAVRGDNVMKGYLNRPEATAAVLRDDWFRTGDLARRDESGYYYIVDRAKDVIIRGGYNIYPREIEELLVSHPAVAQAAVIGMPHESLGEEIKAYVVLKPGLVATSEEILGWAREQLAHYKYPRVVEMIIELPTTSTGKILKRELG